MSRESGLSIGRLAERTGVHLETVRYYERIGLMPAPPRSRGGHRLYDAADLRRLAFIRRARELGFPLGDIRALLAMVEGGHSCAEVQALTLQHLAEVRAKIADLQRLERTLDEIAAKCAGGAVPDCPIIEALSSGRTDVAGASPGRGGGKGRLPPDWTEQPPSSGRG